MAVTRQPFALREATDADAPVVRELVFRVLAEYGLKADPDGADADLLNLEAHYAIAGGWFGVLAAPGGRIVASVGLRRMEPGVFELRKMYLEREFRGRGLGRSLLERALTEARLRGGRRIVLETATVLREAVAMYERYGFRRLEDCPNVCRCDRVMALELG